MLRKATALVLLAACAVHADTKTNNPETLAERSQATARSVLDGAVAAIGGAEALRSIDVVRLRFDGETWPRLQMPTAAPPFESGTQKETLLLDLKNNRLLLEQEASGAGFAGHNTIVIKGGQGSNYDHRGHTITPIPVAQSSQQQFVQYYRRLPHLLLRQALDRTNTLRSLGQDTFEGKPQDVFTFVMADTQQVAVYVDAATRLVSKYELIFVDPFTGEEASEIMFGDYTRAGNFQVPQSWRSRQAGDLTVSAKLNVEINPAVTDQSFDVAADSYAHVAALPDNLEEKVEQLADGVFVIQNVAGQNQNTLAVAFKDYIVAVEAPGSSAGADQVIERIKAAIPGKPIRYVAMTHHHGDHIGGLRSFIAEGATVVTTQANREVVEAMAAAPQLDRLAKNPRKPEFLFVQRGKRVITDGSRTLELLDIGPNPHAREMVIAYLPKERIVFQGDLFFIPPNDAAAGPPQASTVSFAKKLQELRLGVDRIASVHGRTTTMDELNRAMQGATPST
ncbi:MAG TPA: MBL fold metallo-hydrolase [Steroidobacteraceae bacterium]|nr:MBL fold metallo-hydrolase [Steroidobacteraceae bacterium]